VIRRTFSPAHLAGPSQPAVRTKRGAKLFGPGLRTSPKTDVAEPVQHLPVPCPPLRQARQNCLPFRPRSRPLRL